MLRICALILVRRILIHTGAKTISNATSSIDVFGLEGSHTTWNPRIAADLKRRVKGQSEWSTS